MVQTREIEKGGQAGDFSISRGFDLTTAQLAKGCRFNPEKIVLLGVLSESYSFLRKDGIAP